MYKPINFNLENDGIKTKAWVHRNLDIDSLVKKSVKRGEGEISRSGALTVMTGKYTGRSPNDRYIVDEPLIHDKINWGKVNIPISQEKYNKLYEHITDHLAETDELFVFDGIVGADPEHSIKVRVINELASQNLTIRQLLRRTSKEELFSYQPDFTIYVAPGCEADPAQYGLNS